MQSQAFIQALLNKDYPAVKSVAKSDLHNHGMLGYRRSVLQNHSVKIIVPPPTRFKAFDDFEKYLDLTFEPFLKQKDFFELAIKNSFLQARSDGVELLQMSIDSRFYNYFSEEHIVETVSRVHKEYAPDVTFFPQLGMDRTHNFTKLMNEAERLLDTGFFRSIDLYGNEMYGSIDAFIPLYRKAKNMGLVLTAHAGEYGNPESVRSAAEKLELQQIQHGISAAESPEVMKWLAKNKIVLNICPSSNVILCRAESVKKHPIRKLFDQGIRVSLNTDDLFVFDQSVSDEYLNLYNKEVFKPEELEQIRQCGMEAFDLI